MSDTGSRLTDADRALHQRLDGDDGGLKQEVSGGGMRPNPWVAIGRFALTSAVVAGLTLAWSVWRYGSPLGLPQVLEGKILIADRTEVFCGEARAGEERIAAFRLRNITSLPVKVVGMRSSCGCGTTRDFPFAIGPGETESLPLTIHVTDRTPIGELRVSNELMLDTSSAPVTLEASLLVQARQQRGTLVDSPPRGSKP